MINYGYHLARLHGRLVRETYHASLRAVVRRKISPCGELPFEIYSYSGEAALPEQVASIRSLLTHGGRPRKFTVVSDGTYTRRSMDLLRALDSAVGVEQIGDFIPSDVSPQLKPYLSSHPTGKQLALIMSLPKNRPTLYVDSDVLFFPGADALASLHSRDELPALYLCDCQLSADERLLRSAEERQNPVNTGVLFLSGSIDWSLAIARFLELDDEPTFFTNQTMTHLAMHASGARPLDPGKFVLQLDDQFVYADRYAGPDIALRHYVNPVRHKFWSSLYR